LFVNIFNQLKKSKLKLTALELLLHMAPQRR